MSGRAPKIFAETLVPKKSGCCSCGSVTRPKLQEEDDDDNDIEENEFAVCCGFRRRIVCGKLYLPPRRTHNNQHSYANILTPIVIVMQILCGVSIWFINNAHVYLHSNLSLLLYTIIGSAVLCFVTIILQSLCFLSWWRSCTCVHRDFMGDFEEAERNHYLGFKAARDMDEGRSGLAFFSTISPFYLQDEESAQQNSGDMMLNNSDVDVDQVAADDFRFGRNNSKSKKNTTSQISDQDLEATTRFIDQQNSAFTIKIDRLRKAKSMAVLAETAPLFTCCCIDENDWYSE